MWRSISSKALWTVFVLSLLVVATPSATLINLATQVKGILAVANGGTGVTSSQGNGSKVQLSTGSTTTNNCVKFDANGNTVDSGSACGGGGGAPTTSTYVLKTADGSLPNAIVFLDMAAGPDIPPSSANAMDDEMNAAAGGINTGLWTWVNQGSATANYSGNGSLDITAPSHSGIDIKLVVQTLPSAPYKFTTKFSCGVVVESGHNCGMILRESGTGKLLLYGLFYTGGTTSEIALQGYSSPTAYSGSVNFIGTNCYTCSQPTYLRIGRSGSTLTFEISTDGLGWEQITTTTITTPFTTAPDQIGVYSNSETTNGPTDTFVWWFRRTT